MIRRTLESKLKELAKSFPAVAVLGPRQSGKTTLAKVCFPRKPTVLLEDPDVRESAERDPRAFLAGYPDGAILDEVQRVPSLFSYLQGILDRDQRPGRFILTGSQNFLVMERITQSLAGRIAVLKLLPLSLLEIPSGEPSAAFEGVLLRGFYPRLHSPGAPASADWFSSYVQTYLERDVRQLKSVQDLSTFQTFLKMCAHRAGQTLNLSSLGIDCGITHNTAKAWLSVLEAGFIVFLLRPHHVNFRKRLVKAPKLYFHDTGLLCHLLGLKEPSQISFHPARGALFENLILADIHKRFSHAGGTPPMSFWRDKTGHEVDCLLDLPQGSIALEVKAGRTVTDDFFPGLSYWLRLSQAPREKAFVVFAGDRVHPRPEGTVVPWNGLERIPGIP